MPTPQEKMKIYQARLDEALLEPDSLEKANEMFELAEMVLWCSTAETREQVRAINRIAIKEYKRIVDAGHHP